MIWLRNDRGECRPAMPHTAPAPIPDLRERARSLYDVVPVDGRWDVLDRTPPTEGTYNCTADTEAEAWAVADSFVCNQPHRDAWGLVGHKRCVEVNGDGQCGNYELKTPATDELTAPNPDEPRRRREDVPASRLARLFHRLWGHK